jgi:hypothetical protein
MLVLNHILETFTGRFFLVSTVHLGQSHRFFHKGAEFDLLQDFLGHQIAQDLTRERELRTDYAGLVTTTPQKKRWFEATIGI